MTRVPVRFRLLFNANVSRKERVFLLRCAVMPFVIATVATVTTRVATRVATLAHTAAGTGSVDAREYLLTPFSTRAARHDVTLTPFRTLHELCTVSVGKVEVTVGRVFRCAWVATKKRESTISESMLFSDARHVLTVK